MVCRPIYLYWSSTEEVKGRILGNGVAGEGNNKDRHVGSVAGEERIATRQSQKDMCIKWTVLQSGDRESHVHIPGKIIMMRTTWFYFCTWWRSCCEAGISLSRAAPSSPSAPAASLTRTPITVGERGEVRGQKWRAIIRTSSGRWLG